MVSSKPGFRTIRDTSYIVSLCPSSNVYLDVTSVPEIMLPAVSISGGCDDVPSYT